MFKITFNSTLLRGFALACTVAFSAQAQSPTTETIDSTLINYSQVIDEADMKKHLSILASDEYEGRETGEKGQKMAAEYIANYFKSIGITAPVNGSYFQKFELEKSKISQFDLTTSEGKVSLEDDFTVIYSPLQAESADFKFVGYGLEGDKQSDLIGLEGKIAIVLMGAPKGSESKLSEQAQKNIFAQMYAKAATLKSKNASGIVFVAEQDAYQKFYKQYGHYFADAKWTFPVKSEEERIALFDGGMGGGFFTAMTTSKNLATLLNQSEKSWKKTWKKWQKGKKKSLISNAKIKLTISTEKVETENVLGYLEGGDQKDELVVITAHYDHVGVIDGKVYNGADDDGSGTTAVLEIAEAFAKAKKEGHTPKRSVLFMLFTGEEKGLLGSEYYSENPVFPLENTVTNLNIDMIGRMDKAHENNPDYVYIIGSTMLSSQLHELSEATAKTYAPKVALDYTFNTKDDPNRFYYRSDHYNFAKHNIPVIFYFNGVHEDYHQHTDEVDKIHFGKMQNISRLVFATAWQLLNRESRVLVDAEIEK